MFISILVVHHGDVPPSGVNWSNGRPPAENEPGLVCDLWPGHHRQLGALWNLSGRYHDGALWRNSLHLFRCLAIKFRTLGRCWSGTQCLIRQCYNCSLHTDQFSCFKPKKPFLVPKQNQRWAASRPTSRPPGLSGALQPLGCGDLRGDHGTGEERVHGQPGGENQLVRSEKVVNSADFFEHLAWATKMGFMNKNEQSMFRSRNLEKILGVDWTSLTKTNGLKKTSVARRPSGSIWSFHCPTSMPVAANTRPFISISEFQFLEFSLYYQFPVHQMSPGIKI